MKLQYSSLSGINGPLLILDGVVNVSYDEVCDIELADSSQRTGRVIAIEGDRVILQVFEGTSGLSKEDVSVSFTGHPVELALSKDMLGRAFSGSGKVCDGLDKICPDEKRDINGLPINPVSRTYPKSCIYTGISAIDGMSTLIRGQKLPIFSGAGMSHNELAAQIVRQAKVAGDAVGNFGIVFAGMGLKRDIVDFFYSNFEQSGALQRVVMFLNEASDPIIERILTPRCALTCAEYLAFKHGMHILVIMTDMSSYCEAIREFSSSKGEIPSRKGFPSYLYSDLASLYERAGIINGRSGSVTQVPILTMPNDDITHPIPDLTGYITEGQIVLNRMMDQKGMYPPISILPSLSRLMKDGIGDGFTREDHPALATQLFSCYSRVQDARSLASVIGEDELSSIDKMYMQFGRRFEEEFLRQRSSEDRSIERTLEIGWNLLSDLPKSELSRISSILLDKYYIEKDA